MKNKFVTLFSICLTSYSCYAQENKEPYIYKWGLSLAINSVEAQIGDPEWDSWADVKGNFFNYGNITNRSFSLSIIPKYFISNDMVLCFEVGISDINLTNYYDNNVHVSPNNPSTHSIYNQSIEQKIYRFIPGLRWNFIKKKFIESYYGITVNYLHYSDMHYHQVVEARDLSNNDSYLGGFEDKSKATGGFAVGIGALAGFNIYLQKHISFGAEFSSALLYKNIGGNFSGEITDYNPPNPPASRTFYVSSFYKGFEFSKIISSFNISIWL